MSAWEAEGKTMSFPEGPHGRELVRHTIASGAKALVLDDLSVLGDRMSTIIDALVKLNEHSVYVTMNGLTFDVWTLKALAGWRDARFAAREARNAGRPRPPSQRRLAQDEKIARMLRDGGKVREIAAAVSVSPNTVMRIRKQLSSPTA